MYMDTGLVVGTTIALGLSLLLIIALAYANTKLIEENRFLRRRLRLQRKKYEGYTEVPF
jgi:hypothetical protein